MSNYIRNTSCRCKLWFYVVLPNCSEYGNFIYVAEIWIVEDWLSPGWSASSHCWNLPNVVSICNGTGRAWFLAHVMLQVWPWICKFYEDYTWEPKAVDDIYVAALPIFALLLAGMNVKHAETPRSYVWSRKPFPQLLYCRQAWIWSVLNICVLIRWKLSQRQFVILDVS